MELLDRALPPSRRQRRASRSRLARGSCSRPARSTIRSPRIRPGSMRRPPRRGLLPRRRRRAASAPTPRSSRLRDGAARRLRRLGPARARGVARDRRPCSSPTCSPRRATGSRWPTGSRAATRSSTTGSTRSRRRCRRRASWTGLRDKVALRDLADELLPRGDRGPPQAALPRAGGRAVLRRRRPRVGRGDALARQRSTRSGSGTRDGSRAWCGAAGAAARPGVREGMALVGGPVDPALARGVHRPRPAT